MLRFDFFNEDCIEGAKKRIEDNSIDLIIADPPFGIGEASFESMYNREENVIENYQEAPEDYNLFSKQWIEQATRVLKKNGTMYIVSCWTNLYDVLDAIKENKLIILNHIIWKYNFGVFTKNKFISSHYHILRVSKSENVTFNSYCRFGPQEKKENGNSLLNEDLEDVFIINKEYHRGEFKNQNKLPNELINKLILYSSNEGDLVSDFFLGNFTTAYCSKGLNRSFIGFEINKESFNYHINKIKNFEEGSFMVEPPEVIVPKNKGKRITEEEVSNIHLRFKELEKTIPTKKEIIEILGDEFGRGKFSIINILKK
jgi:site-specific DNA-methyltransferase (adenine-specific)